MSTERDPADREGGDPSDERPRQATGASESEDDLGTAGWILTGVVVLSFLVIPGYIYLFPATPGQFGLSFLATYIALPMIPAVLLGAIAVWSAVSSR